MFEVFHNSKAVRVSGWAAPVMAAAILVTATPIVGAWAKSVWTIEALTPPNAVIELRAFAVPSPPPPPPGGGKPKAAAKPERAKRLRTPDVVQPPQDVVAPQAQSAETTDDAGLGDDGQHLGDSDGEIGGTIGGTGDSIAAPVVAPPAAPANVVPTALEQQRIAGNRQILPDNLTKQEIARSGRNELIGVYKVCITEAGSIANVVQLKSTGFPAYDLQIQREISDWRYRPFLVNGRPTPVCTAVRFVYRQKQ